jgi:17 kDa outer membrane surface antigen
MGETFGVRQAYSVTTGACPSPAMHVHPCGRRVARFAAMAMGLLTLPGCAVTLPSLWERTQTAPPVAAEAPPSPAAAQGGDPDPVTTGSVHRRTDSPAPAASTANLPIPEPDWQAAKKVLLEALADRADTPSIPWENSQSGMRGTVTALQRSTSSAGQTCRDFLGSAIKDGKEVWFDGRACRTNAAWDVLEVRPWRRS